MKTQVPLEPAILSISSQVVYSTVGNTAAVPTMQRLGVTVLAVPTVLLSNHPGLGVPERQSIEAGTLEGLIRRLMEQGRLDSCAAVYTGYFAAAAQVEAVARTIGDLKRRRPRILYHCDPVIGDDHTHLYVLPEVAHAVRNHLVPIADILSPNRFELQWLTGHDVTSLESTVEAARSLGVACILAHSVPTRLGYLATMVVTADRAAYVETRLREGIPHGTGDVVSGLFLSHLCLGRSEEEALGRTVAGIEAVLDRSEGLDSLDLSCGLSGAETLAARNTRQIGRSASGLVAGVDGCPGGWLTVLWDGDSWSKPSARVMTGFQQILETTAEVIAVDMPIGFPERLNAEGRGADRLVRMRLGERQSSVFPVPVRASVMAANYAEACAINLAASEPPRKVSKQCFMLFPKMREIDALMTPDLQSRIFEVHPELAFWAMNGGRPLAEPKKVKGRPFPPGLALRRRLLTEGGFPADHIVVDGPHQRWAEDDLLDACAAAWSARRIRDGEQLRLPEDPPRDGKGLRMEINA